MAAKQEEKQFIRMFNIGYQMQQHEPELLASILKSNNHDNKYIKAMAAGKNEQEKDQKKLQTLQKEKEKIIKQQQQIREKQKAKKRGR
jgi:hypothetical protein